MPATRPPSGSQPADRAVVLLQETRELLLQCRAVAEPLGAGPPGDERATGAAERIAYSVLVAAIEEGLAGAAR
jgi:hypothetical protein